jgi:rubrerythrin
VLQTGGGMNDELAEVWDNAIYKEVASQALYLEAQRGTEDPAAIKMLAELASEELKHVEILRNMKEAGWAPGDWNPGVLTDLKLSDYLKGPDTLQGAGLQEVLIFAMKREEQSVVFYSQLMSVFRFEAAKSLCARLAQEELKHKMKLEMEYQVLLPEREY